MTGKTIWWLVKRRTLITRLFALILLPVILFTGSSWKQGGLADVLFEASGLVLVTICAFGRLWSLLYISGRKSDTVVTEGPYSIVRHPLYLFSAIGTVGVGLASENLLVLGLLVAFYALYYPMVLIREESNLAEKFGNCYTSYMAKTPRFIPRFSLYNQPDEIRVNTAQLLRTFAESIGFVWSFLLLYLIEALQEAGCLPVFLRVP